MFDRARAECRSGEPGLRGHLLVLTSGLGMLAVDVAVVAAIPPFRSGVADGTWWGVVALICLVTVSLFGWALLMVEYAAAGEVPTETRLP